MLLLTKAAELDLIDIRKRFGLHDERDQTSGQAGKSPVPVTPDPTPAGSPEEAGISTDDLLWRAAMAITGDPSLDVTVLRGFFDIIRRKTVEDVASHLEKEMSDPYVMRARARTVREKFGKGRT
jgi:hypothetical protein